MPPLPLLAICFGDEILSQRIRLNIEPFNGWRGANVNQSKPALEWLCYEDFKLGENRLRHFRNGGEQKVNAQGEAMFVDGYDEATNY